MFEQLPGLPICAHIKFAIFILLFKAQQDLAPEFVADVILEPFSALLESSAPLFKQIFDLLVPHILEQLWLSPGPLHQFVPFFGMLCLHS